MIFDMLRNATAVSYHGRCSLPAIENETARLYNEVVANPWLSIPLEDYEGHMGDAGVQQTPALAEFFRHALDRFHPKSVAVLGVAGGNGLEHIDPAVTKRVIGVDINQRYLDEVRRRFGALTGLELYCRDLGGSELDLPRVDLVHAAMIFEHAGLGRALDNALSIVAPSGTFSVVLQLPSASGPGVAQTSYSSMQKVKENFALIDTAEFQRMLAQRGFRLIDTESRPLPGGKAFWYGAFRIG